MWKNKLGICWSVEKVKDSTLKLENGRKRVDRDISQTPLEVSEDYGWTRALWIYLLASTSSEFCQTSPLALAPAASEGNAGALEVSRELWKSLENLFLVQRVGDKWSPGVRECPENGSSAENMFGGLAQPMVREPLESGARLDSGTQRRLIYG
jgi:hypothetical protein